MVHADTNQDVVLVYFLMFYIKARAVSDARKVIIALVSVQDQLLITTHMTFRF